MLDRRAVDADLWVIDGILIGLGMKSRLFAAIVENQSSPAYATFRWFNSDAVVHCVLQSLSAPEILFRCLYAHMTK